MYYRYQGINTYLIPPLQLTSWFGQIWPKGGGQTGIYPLIDANDKPCNVDFFQPPPAARGFSLFPPPPLDFTKMPKYIVLLS